ncbi:D-alanyl-D-alanine carboxypeptidase (penicillin-binding protein 5/6) [Rheinheimera pacifica]|uniref:serine-type D-Ala-D-Ala carboxypeptidase n=1 Tax=Rheinheimera pacifica TaxID=173990 RepID=A0A1H6MUS5_9GAMM|nr:serine hydrolase [Rheinheimera pacifica]SEI01415.1 D-alanyl-D-alanine carboxypeptidase (penicillin-binding protein 5/6) [Rheinheimera pacifica]
MKSYCHIFAVAAVSLASASFSLSAIAQTVTPQPPEVAAKGHILIDFDTGKVLSEHNADMSLAPASLTKMMTSYVIGTELKNGNITNEDMVTISENAWAKNFPGSSLMFIEVGTQVSVADLNKGIIIQSGNDACVALAEHIAGSESAFVDLMNAHAERLGMTSSRFGNSHGLPSAENYSTPRDMAKLSAALIRDVPDEYAIYAEKEFTYNNIKQYNRNSLLWDRSLEVDGIKTGHTSEAGFSLITSATRDGMRLVSVVMGTNSERARQAENKKLLTYGFRFFETFSPYQAGEKFAEQRIWQGDKENIQLGILQSAQVTIPRGQRKNLQADFTLNQQLLAPITKGQQVGTIYLKLNGEDIATYPLVALEDVAQGGFFSRIIDYIKMQFN